ncbi:MULTISPECIES: Trm112 family protein [unclassified Geodermatophilus]
MTAAGPLGLDPVLLGILACPDTHHSPLTVDEAAGELVCDTCGRAYPVRDGIPVLLLDEARDRRAGGDRRPGGGPATP